MTLGFSLLGLLLALLCMSTCGLTHNQTSRNPIPARDADFTLWFKDWAANLGQLNVTAPGNAVVTFTVVAGAITAGAVVSGGYGYTVSGGPFTLPAGVGGGAGVTGTLTAAAGVVTAVVIVGGGAGYLGGGGGTFTAVVQSLPGTALSSLGITAAQVTAAGAAYLAGVTAYSAATNPSTNTKAAAVRLKREARWAASGGKRAIPGFIRPIMRQVTAFLDVDSINNPTHRPANDTMLQTLAWHIPTLERTPILPPTKGPIMEVVGYGAHSLQVEYRTALGTLVNGRPAPQGRGKPPGVKQCQVAVSIPSLWANWVRMYNLTRSPAWLELPTAAIGHEATIVGVWVVQKGDNRPGVSSTSSPGNPIQDVIPGNGVSRRTMGGALGTAQALLGAEQRLLGQ